MDRPRSIAQLLTARPTVEGAGVRLQRVFGHAEAPRFDPFLLLDDFGSDDPADFVAGFPWHPHRGIETVTYMMAGEVAHADSLGNRGVIGAGALQWMTAGSGIIHEEMPQATGGRLRGLQLWVNLPRRAKMDEPAYLEVTQDAFPTVSPHPGLQITVVAGEVVGVRGPVSHAYADVGYFDVRLQPEADLEHPIPHGHTVFAYAVEGRGAMGPRASHSLDRGQLALFTDGEAVHARALDVPFRFILVAGRPYGEPIAWSGPIVMNTHEELADAFRELRDGTFVANTG